MLLLTNCEVHRVKYSDRSFEVRTEGSDDDAPGLTGFYSPEPFRILLSDIILSLSVYITQCIQQSSI